MQLIPLNAVPAQTLSVQLGGQSCRIAVYTRETGLYLDVAVNDRLIIGGVICLDRNRIVRDEYLGFIGDLAFSDTQGADDPVASGLGERFQLVYLGAGE